MVHKSAAFRRVKAGPAGRVASLLKTAPFLGRVPILGLILENDGKQIIENQCF